MYRFVVGALALTVSCHSLVAQEYDWELNEERLVWNERDSWNFTNIARELTRKGYSRLEKKSRSNSQSTDIFKLDQTNWLQYNYNNFLANGCNRDASTYVRIPNDVYGAHLNTHRINVSIGDPGYYGFLFPWQWREYGAIRISENTPYEFQQQQQSRRGTKRASDWFTHWNIGGFLFSNSKNHMHTYGPLTFTRTLNQPIIVNSYTTVKEGIFSVSFSGTLDIAAGVLSLSRVAGDWKSGGKHPYACTDYALIVEANTRPFIGSITRSSNSYTVQASDTHTTNDFLQYNWEFIGANGRRELRTGRTVNAFDSLFGSSVSVRVIVSDGDLAATRTQTFQLANNTDPGYPTCPGCQIP